MATPTTPREQPRQYRTSQVSIPTVNPIKFQEDPTAAGLDLLQQSLTAVGDHLVEAEKVRKSEGLFDLDIALKQQFTEGLFQEDQFITKWNTDHPDTPIDGLGTRARQQVEAYAGKSHGYESLRTLKAGIADQTIGSTADLEAARQRQVDILENEGAFSAMHKLGFAEESRTEYDNLHDQMWLLDAEKAKTQQRTSAAGRANELFSAIFDENSTPGVTLETTDAIAIGIRDMQDDFSKSKDPQGEVGSAVLTAATELLSDEGNYALGDDLIDTIDAMELMQTGPDRMAWAKLKKAFYKARDQKNNEAGTAAETKAVRHARGLFSRAAAKNKDGKLTQENYDAIADEVGFDIADMGRAAWAKTQGVGSVMSDSNHIGEARNALDEARFNNNQEGLDDILDVDEARKLIQKDDPKLYESMVTQRDNFEDNRGDRQAKAMKPWLKRSEDNSYFVGDKERDDWVQTMHEKMDELPEHGLEDYGTFMEQQYILLEKEAKVREKEDKIRMRSPTYSWETQVYINDAKKVVEEKSEALVIAQQDLDFQLSPEAQGRDPVEPGIMGLLGTQAAPVDEPFTALGPITKAKREYLAEAENLAKLIAKQNRQLKREKEDKGLSPLQKEEKEYHNGPNDSVADYDDYTSQGDF